MKEVLFFALAAASLFSLQGFNMRFQNDYNEAHPNAGSNDWLFAFMGVMSSKDITLFVAYLTILLVSSTVMMKVETIRHGIKYEWFYQNASMFLGSGVSWPLFLWRFFVNTPNEECPNKELKPATAASSGFRFKSLWLVLMYACIAFMFIGRLGESRPWYVLFLLLLGVSIVLALVPFSSDNGRALSKSDSLEVLALYAATFGAGLVFVVAAASRIMIDCPYGDYKECFGRVLMLPLTTQDYGFISVAADAAFCHLVATLFVAMDRSVSLTTGRRFWWVAACALVSPVVFPLYMMGREVRFMVDPRLANKDKVKDS